MDCPTNFIRCEPLFVILTMMGLALPSCANLSQEPPEKSFYALKLQTAQPDESPPQNVTGRTTAAQDTNGRGPSILRVAPMRVVAPYDGRGFVYRTGENQYEIAYYDQFVAAPGDLLTELLREQLADSKTFNIVLGTDSQVQARYMLETTLSSLYGDYTDKSAPQARIAMRVQLIDLDAQASSIILQRNYSASAPIKRANAKGLVRGWEKALNQIFQNITSDLERSHPNASQ